MKLRSKARKEICFSCELFNPNKYTAIDHISTIWLMSDSIRSYYFNQILEFDVWLLQKGKWMDLAKALKSNHLTLCRDGKYFYEPVELKNNISYSF